MSRCFPFPPPGYERKPRIDDTNALKEEKKKEKKHKKEKKDKEKREGKDKTDKERSDGKHREKKDKKEKNKKEKDRDRRKDKGKDDENGSTAGTSGVPSIPATKVEDKLGTEVGRDKTSFANEKTNGSFFHRQNGEKPFSSSHPFGEVDDSRFVLELARRINDEGKVTANQLDSFSGAEKKKSDEGERTPYKSSGNLLEVKRKESKNKDKHIEEEMGEKGNRDEVRFSETSIVLAGTGKIKFGDLPRAVEEKEKRVEGKEKRTEEKEKRVERKEKRMEETEKAKEKDDKTKNKRKSKEEEKKSHRKDKDKEKEKKKAEKAKGKKEDKKTEPDKSENVNQIDFPGRKNGPDNSSNGSRSCPVGSTETTTGSVPLSDHRKHNIVEGNEKNRKEFDINGFLYPVGFTEVTGSISLSDRRNHAMVEGNEKKRKEIDRNGFLYDNEVKPDKIPRQLLENGRMLDSNQSPILLTPEKHSNVQGVSLHLKVDNKKQRKNGLVESKSVPILGPTPPGLNGQVIEKSRKPPHPDTQFLSQILTVPKMDDLSEFDDQEWLFGSKDPSLRKNEVGSASASEELQVWSKALTIESADIIALPYVLPY